jgi:hypothetical protein
MWRCSPACSRFGAATLGWTGALPLIRLLLRFADRAIALALAVSPKSLASLPRKVAEHR